MASSSFANVQNAMRLSATENKMVIEKPTINFVLRLNFSIDLSADTLNFPSKYEGYERNLTFANATPNSLNEVTLLR